MRKLAATMGILWLSTCLAAQTKLPRADVVVDSLTLTGAARLSQPEQQQIVDDVEDHKYQRSNLSEIKERVLYALQTRGYFKAHVAEPQIRVLSQTKRQEAIAVTVAVNEGEQYRLKDISFRNPKFFTSDELRRQFPLQNGDIFDTDKIRRGLEAMRKLYAGKGYPNFAPVPNAQVDDSSRTVALNITIDEGSNSAKQ